MRSFFFPALFTIGVAAAGIYSYAGKGSNSPSGKAAIAVAESPATALRAASDLTLARALEAVRVLDTAPDRGLDPARYGRERLQAAIDHVKGAGGKQIIPDELENLDREANRALVAFAHDATLGRRSPTAIDPTWKSRRRNQDFAASLDQAANGRLMQWVDGLEPHHPEYRALQRALRDLRAQEQQGGWPAVPLRRLKPGLDDPAVVILRKRLAASGELPQTTVSDSTAYDETVEAAVKAFQEHHAMQATGIADRATLVAMNVPLRDRVRQLEINLERWRWMPDDFGSRHFLVNIPAYLLMAREDGRTVRAMRVVVGKPGHETPVFSGNMDTVVFSPYWNVPDSIAEDETGPAIREDPDYLVRNQIEILRRTKSGTKVVDPAAINWYDPDDQKDLSFRQRPGAKNALGHVKFLFPNPFNVYLHDTPADSLFERTGRAFSHGCVRVEEPEALAAYVLRDDAEWTTARIAAAMNAGVEKYVKLSESIPVHIAYFTAWVDERGGVHFLPDVYGYDARQSKLMR